MGENAKYIMHIGFLVQIQGFMAKMWLCACKFKVMLSGNA